MQQKLSYKFNKLRDFSWALKKPYLIYQWVKHWGSMPVFSWLKGAEYYLNHNFRLAALHYNLGLKKHLNHPAKNCARMDYSYCLYRNGELKAALNELKQLCSEEKKQKECFLLAAKIYSYLGNLEMALTILSSALKVFPKDPIIIAKFLHLNIEANTEEKSLDRLKNKLLAIKLSLHVDDEKIETIDTAIAHYYLAKEDYDEGEKILARILATGKAPFEAVLLKGQRLLELGRIMPARDQLARAMKMAPRNPYAPLLLAESYLDYENYEEPESALQLSRLACQLSNWENIECLQTHAIALERNYDASTAELMELRCKKMISSYNSPENFPDFSSFGEVRIKGLRLGIS